MARSDIFKKFAPIHYFLKILPIYRIRDGIDTLKKNKAVGVEVYHNRKVSKYFANNEIISTAGTYISPKLLMLSGIGDQAELSKHNIKTIEMYLKNGVDSC